MALGSHGLRADTALEYVTGPAQAATPELRARRQVMNRRIVVAIAGGSLGLGIVVGAAGAVAVRDVTSPAVTTIPAHMAGMNGMHGLMADQMGTEMASP